MSDNKLDLLSQLLQTVGGAGGGVRQNEDGSKQYGIVPMLAGMAGSSSALQDQKIARKTAEFNLEEAKRESERRQQEWELNKQDREQKRAQEGFAYSEKLKEYDNTKKLKQIELNKAALAEEGRTGKVQPRQNLSDDAFVPVMDPATGKMTTKKSASQELADKTTAQSLNNESTEKMDLTYEGKIKEPMAEAKDIIGNAALAGPIGLANGFFLSKFSEDKSIKETKKVAIDPVTGKPNFYDLNSKDLTVLSILSNQQGNSLAEYGGDIRDALKFKSSDELSTMSEVGEITAGLKQHGVITDEESVAMTDQYQTYLDRGKDPIKPKQLYTQILNDLKQSVPAEGPQMALIAKAAMMTTLKTLNGELAKMNQERAPKRSITDSPFVAPEKAKLFEQQRHLDKARKKSKDKLGKAANQPLSIK